jgi:transcription elongation factor GreA
MSYIVTQEGFDKLKEELVHRIDVVRQEIAGAIKEAKDQGDLSENAEYSEAKREQAENEQRIAELEDLVKNAQIESHSDAKVGVQIGSKVTIDCEGRQLSFEIVGFNEVQPESGKISTESPFGKALMGHDKGGTVTVETPTGQMKCKILTLS